MKAKKLMSVMLALCMVLSVVPMMGITANAVTDPLTDEGYVAYVVPHTLNADGTAVSEEEAQRPTTGTFTAYLYDATGATVTSSATTLSYEGLEVTEGDETRYYYKSIDAAMAAAQAGETNLDYATDDNQNGVIIEGEGGGTYAGNDYLNPNLGKYTDTVVLLCDVDGYLYNYVRNQYDLSASLVDNAVTAERYGELTNEQKYGIHKGIIVDLNEHTVGGISGGVIPDGETLIIKNGTVSGTGANIVNNSAYDDENWNGTLTGNVVFSGVTLSGKIFSGNHGFVFLDGKYEPKIQSGEDATAIKPYSGYYVKDPATMGASVDFMNFHVQSKDEATDADSWPEGYSYRILKGASSYNVKLDVNGADNTILVGGEEYTGETLTKVFKSDIALTTGLSVQGRSEFNFLGWSANKYATAADFTDTLNTDIGQRGGETVTLYAVWDASKPTSVSVSPIQKSINLSTDSDTFTVRATVDPSDAFNTRVNWSSSNEKVATVDEDGNVTAVGCGYAYITATLDADGSKSATCTVTVTHEHSWSYTANGDTITAECTAKGNCDIDTNKTLTISYDWTNKIALLSAAEIAGQTALPEIYYEGASGTEYTKSTAAPGNDVEGNFIASVTIDGATAYCSFTNGVGVSYLYPVYKSTGQADPSFYEEAAAGIELWADAICIDPETIDDSYSGGALGTSGATTWYYVTCADKTVSKRIVVNGDVNIILKDGAKLTASSGIGVNNGNSLTIYAESTGDTMGKLVATGSDNTSAVIGGYKYKPNGPITINGGQVSVTQNASSAPAIGGGQGQKSSNIVINGGAVTATANFGAGIGGSNEDAACSNIVINGGTVTATGFTGIGCCDYYDAETYCENITINGGTVTATGTRAAGIGCGTEAYANNITISGGTVTATGAVGIGACGYQSTASNITISGGTVTATATNDDCPGIGSYSSSASNIKICTDVTDLSGFVKVLAIGGSNASGIGRGRTGSATDIKVNKNLATKADSSTNPPTFSIDNSGEDLASALSGKRYVLIDRGLGELTVSGTIVLDKQYDGTTEAAVTVGNVTGIADGDYVDVIATAEFEEAAAGTHKVTVSYDISGRDAAKYAAPASQEFTATITPVYMSILACDIAKYYAGDPLASDDEFTFVSDGLGKGDTVTPTFDTSGINPDKGGVYPITISAYTIENAKGEDMTVNYTALCLGATYYVFYEETRGITYSASLTLNRGIDINFKMKKLGTDDMGADFDASRLEIMVDGEAWDGYTIAGGTLSGIIKEVEAKEISEELYIEIIYKDIPLKSFTYSIRDYCEAVFAANTEGKYDKLAELCKSILNYGAAMENYLNQNDNSTFNEGYEYDYSQAIAKGLTDDEILTCGGDVDDGSATIILGSTISLQFRVYTDEIMTIGRMYIIDDTATYCIPMKNLSMYRDTANGCYVVTVNGIEASKLFKTYRCTYGDIKPEDFSIKYSVKDYCCRMASSSSDARIVNLCKAIYYYGKAASEYSK